MEESLLGGEVEINGRRIGGENDPYIVAEMSGNHKGEIENAFKIVTKAKECGADAIKIQTYTADTITINHDSPEFIVKDGIWKGKKLYNLYQEAHTPWEWHSKLFKHAQKIGITIFSSPFDLTSVDFLEELNCPVYKIASPELIDIPLIKKVAKTGKPMILSTGLASYKEINEAINAAREEGATKLIVLHCTSSYPAPPEEANLRAIKEISNSFKVISGLSDHTKGITIPLLSVMMGAKVIEKHFMLNEGEGGLDSQFSINPEELRTLVETTKLANLSKGDGRLRVADCEKTSIQSRKSLYVISNIKKGEIFTPLNVKSIRPGLGIKPSYYESILGKKASRDIKFGEPLCHSMIIG